MPTDGLSTDSMMLGFEDKPAHRRSRFGDVSGTVITAITSPSTTIAKTRVVDISFPLLAEESAIFVVVAALFTVHNNY
jgi:hypothetical protein